MQYFTELPEQQPTPLVVVAMEKRILRNRILNQTVDRVNPIRYGTLTAEQITELQEFRQALLDVPEQPGFPNDIQWPNKPSWL